MKNSAIGIFLFGLGLIMAACATRYGPEDLVRTGFSDTALSETVHEIRVTGNNFTHRDRVHEIAFFRAAELARDKGYEFVLFRELESWSLTHVYETSGAHEETITDRSVVSGEDITLPDHAGRRSALSSYHPDIGKTSKPRVRLVVEFVGEGGPEHASAIRIDQLIEKYTAEYN